MDSTGIFQGIFNQSNLSVDSGDFIISGLADNKVVGAVSSHLTTDNVSTDWLTEGPTNQYFTTTRARAAFSSISPVNIVAGEISLGYSGSIRLNGTSLDTIQPIETTSSPQFARLSDSSINSFNQIIGTEAGQNYDGPFSVIIGHQAVNQTSTASQLVSIGYRSLYNCTGNLNTAIGATAGYEITSGNSNVLLGANAGRGATPLTTGSSNLYLGFNTYPSASSASNEIVIGTGIGAGNNTAKIYASSGLVVSNLTAGVLKSSSTGLITSNATTDDLVEGKTNLYFTDTRARGAFSPGTNITLAAGVIATTSNPTFSIGATIGTLNITSMTSNITNGLSLGTGAGTAGDFNVYLGDQTGTSATGDANVAVGVEALANATGDNSVAVGWQACCGATGSSNVGVGYRSLFQATGNNSVAVGLAAGYNTKTSGNVCLGTSTGQNLLTGSGYNIYVGSGVPSSSSASYEIVLGGHPSGITGKGNNTCFISASSGLYVSNLTDGVLKSSAAGLITSNATTDDLPEGKTNLYFTNNRARAAITAAAPIFAISGIISLGYNTTNLRLTGSNLDTIQDINTVSSPQFTRLLSSSLSTRNVLCGTNSGAAITSGVDCVAIGHNALTAITTAGTSTAVGSQALRFATGGSNTGVGFYVLRELTTGNQNTAFGAFAGSLITTGSFNTLMGLSAGYNITSGSTNYCLGLNAGYSISSSSDNIALGAYAMGKNTAPITTTNGRNIAIGHYASHSLEGTPSNNIAIGYNALYSATATSNNTIVGSISATSTTTAINNTVVGASCMNSNVTGSNNTIIGYNSGQSINGGVYNIHIGVGCQASALNASSEVIIAGTSGTTVGKGAGTCYISSPYGLYYYNPAICYLYGTGLSNGRVQWAAWDTPNVPTKGFYFGDYGNGPNTVIIPNFYGHYEITINGAVLGNGSNLTLTFNNTNVRNYNVWYQSFSQWGIAYSLSATMIARPYTVVNLSGFEFQLTNMTLWGGLSLYVCIKFIGF